jgi:concanavalin A-like lectin/glucanase superfamily protein/putative metal-binding protein
MPASRMIGSRQLTSRFGWTLVLSAALSLPAAANPPCVDNDADSYVDCTTACVLQPGQFCGDCRDDDPTVHPGAPDAWCNGIDDNCNGQIDEGSPFACQCAELGSGVVSWWPGNGNSTDIRGSHNGTLMNGATYVTGEVGQAFSLDGVDDFVQVAHDPSLDPGAGSFTVAAWVKTSMTGPTQMVLSKYECGGYCPPGANPYYELFVSTTGTPGFGLRDLDGQTVQGITGPASVADGSWHHLAAERDISAHTMSLYVDGLRVMSNPLTSSADGFIGDSDGEPDPLILGAQVIGGTTSLTDFFSGALDEVMYFNCALSAAEVHAIYASGTTGMCPCIDNDRDGYGEAAGVACAAGGQQDCDDTQPAVYPGARVLVSGLRVLANKTDLSWNPSWNPFFSVQGYDVVKGNLNVLRSSGGDFTSSRGCLDIVAPYNHASDVDIPLLGDGFYYVVRYHLPQAPGCAGTFDSGSPWQVGSRDAEIVASCLACHPPACPSDYSCRSYGNLCCSDVASCSDVCYWCPVQCPGTDPSIGHCTTNQDCGFGTCDFEGCTPSSCGCDMTNGQWVCTSDCLGHCI